MHPTVSIITLAFSAAVLLILQLRTAGGDNNVRERDVSTLRIGMVVSSKANEAIWVDVRAVSWAIQQPSDLHRASGISREVHLFYTDEIDGDVKLRSAVEPLFQLEFETMWLHGSGEDEEHAADFVGGPATERTLQGGPTVAGPGMSFGTWVVGMHAIVFVGIPPDPIACSNDRIRCIHIPPPLQPSLPSSFSVEDLTARLQVMGRTAEVWVRGPSEEAWWLSQLKPAGPKVVLIPWSVPDVVIREGQHGRFGPDAGRHLAVVLPLLGHAGCDAAAIKSACATVTLVNKGGRTQQRGASTQLILIVWAKHLPAVSEMAEASADCGRLQRQALLSARPVAGIAELRLWLSLGDVAMFPCGCACGWRSGVLSALHAGLPIVAPDLAPFNETATHQHDGILVRPSAAAGDQHDGECCASEEALATALELLLLQPEASPSDRQRSLLRRLTAPQPGLLLARRSAFVLHVHHRLVRSASDPPPTAVSFWPGPHADHRRTELFRADAFRRHGFAVRDETYSADLGRVFRGSVELVLVAKPRVAFLQELRRHTSAPVFLWTWDLIDFDDDPTRRTWFEEAMRLCTAAFLNEMGREGMWARRGGRVHFVNDGTVLVSNRGPSRRPSEYPPADVGSEVVFIGSVHAKDTPRISALRALLDAGVEVDIYGPERQWAALNFSTVGQVWAEQAYAVEAMAKVVLAISRSPPDIALYRSDRLFRATAGGCCIVTNAFHGIDLLLPEGSVRWVEEEGGAAAVVREVQRVLGDAEGRWEMRQRAEEATWRRLTWEDSVRKFLFWRRRLQRSAAAWPRFCAPGAVCDGAAEEEDEEGCGSSAVRYYESVASELLAEDQDHEAQYYLLQGLGRCPAHAQLALLAAVAALRLGDAARAARLSHTARRLGSSERVDSTARSTSARQSRSGLALAEEVRRFRQQVGAAVAGEVEGRCGLRFTGASSEEPCAAGDEGGGGSKDGACRRRDVMATSRDCMAVVEIVMYSNRLARQSWREAG